MSNHRAVEAEAHPAQISGNGQAAGSQGGKSIPLAIIGVSGRYPGAENLDVLWKNLSSGVDGVTEATGDRWDMGHHAKDSDQPNRIYTKSGGFLKRIDSFDAEFFGMSPREVIQIDPQHRLLLELTWEALEAAGVRPSKIAGSKTGVFVGISNQDYASLADQPVDAYTNIGSAMSIASNRISYVFDLHGPSMSIDTACSSSLVAMHQACNALAAGDCSMAIVGGVNMLASVRPFIGFSEASMLSPDGRCKSFDADGNGYVRAEGGGIVIVKPLADAERDGNEILGVILATGVNSDGRTMGLALPSGEAQEALLRDVYGRSGVSVDDVFYVEAHGTGTSVGDPIECGAIGRVLGEPRKTESVCHIGSIKSNIGHLESGAAVAGLTKLLLALKHRRLPANLHFNTPNPKIDFDGWKLKVVDKALPLPESEKPLVFGINSFGFGGTNAHLVLQDYRSTEKATVVVPEPEVTGETWNDLLLLSARSPAALTAMASTWADFLKSETDADWSAIRSTAAVYRDQQSYRLVVAGNREEASARLAAFAAGETTQQIAKGRGSDKPAKVALVFSGNGPQWWGMGRELMAESALFRAKMVEIDAIFSTLSGWSLIAEMQKPEADCRIGLTEIAQPLLFAQQVALTEVLRAAGVKADATFGHSVGEVAAAWASGALSLAMATEVIFHRSQMQAQTAGKGRMAAVGLGIEDARREMAEIPGWLEVAAVNSPRAVTVAGDIVALETLRDQLTDKGHFVRILPLDYPFHTKAMDVIKDQLLDRLQSIVPGKADVPFISTVEGREVDGTALGSAYWWRNIREPVNFSGAVASALRDHGITAFIEIGPHPVLKDYVVQCVKAAEGSSGVALTTLRRPSTGKPAPEMETIKTAICAIHAAGAADAEAIFARPAKPHPLPDYPWQRVRYWRGVVELPDVVAQSRRDHVLLGARSPSTDGLWTNTLHPEVLTWLDDHVVQNVRLFPAAGYIEMSLSAAGLTLGDGPMECENFEILRPLVIAARAEPIIQSGADRADGTISIRSKATVDAPEWIEHVRGRITKVDTTEAHRVIDLAALQVSMPIAVTAADHYVGCDRRGLSYGPTFQGVSRIHLTPVAATERAALGEIYLPTFDAETLNGYRSHPALLDSCLQVLITLIGQTETRDCATIPVHVERIRSFAPLVNDIRCHVRLIRENARSGVADFDVTDRDGKVLLTLEGARFQKVEFRSTELPLLTEGWQVDPTWIPRARMAIDLPAPTAVAAGLKIDAVKGAVDAAAGIDALALAFALQALQAIGAHEAAFTATTLARKAEIASDQTPLLDCLIQFAAKEGFLAKLQGKWSWVANRAVPQVQPLFKSLMEAHPGHMAELMALSRAGDGLVARLKGTASSQGVAMIETLEDSSPFREPANRLASLAVKSIVENWPTGHAIRVVELNAGTGGLAAHVLPLLPAARTDYLLTDPSEQALARAGNRFGHFPALRTAPANDVALNTGYHLGLATIEPKADEAAADAFRAVCDRLVPGGVAVIIVGHGSRFADMVFAGDLTGARLAASDVEAALHDAGFEDVAILSDGSEPALHSVAIARRAKTAEVTKDRPVSESRRRTLLVSGSEFNAPFVAAIENRLTALGQPANTRLISQADFTEEAMLALVRSEAETTEFVHLAGWNVKSPTRDAILPATDMRCLSTILLARAIETVAGEADGGTGPTLTLVTCGALAGPDGLGPREPLQAGLAGLGRVIANEQGSLGCRLIDVPADEADVEAGSLLADALVARDAETETLLLNGQRWVNRVRETSAAGEALAAKFLPAVGTAGDSMEPIPFKLDFLAQGGLDSLHLAAIDRRAPGEGEIEIRVQAAGLNFRDVLWTMGMLPEDAVEHGFSGPTIGMECAGEVVRIGASVTTLKPGDRVIAFASSCFASHVTTTAACAARMPDRLSYAEAATIPTAFVTAWYALDYLARIEPGETVLIHGAAGGVGLAALQIAKLKGAIVIGTAGAADKQRLVRSLGADHVLSSRSLRFADDVMAITGGKGVDIVLNSLAGEAITKGLQVLRPFGRFLEIGKRDLYANSRIGLRPFRQNLSYFGIDADTLLVERPDLARRMFSAVVAAMEAGELQPLPHQTTPITRAAEAFRAMQQSRHVGKLVVTVDDAAVATAAVVPRKSSTVRSGVTYLVTGGLGGFGLATAEWLVSEGATSLALLSRRGASTDEALEGIARMTAQGCDVRAFACDVSDAAALNATLTEIRLQMAPLKGVIHSAAVIDDAPLMKIDQALLHRVYAAKVQGAFHLDQATRGDDLEMFVLYSSSSALVGNPGQGAYVAANLCLDALAAQRRANGLAALSVGWGAIKDAGFLTRNQQVEAILAQRAGMEATPVRDAVAALGKLLSCGAVRVAAAQFNLMRLGQSLAGARTPRFSTLLPAGMTLAPEGAGSMASALEALGEDERRALLMTRVREHVGRVIGSGAAQIDPERSLSELGLDSLMAVELAEALEQDIGKPVSVMQMIQAGKISGVVETVMRSFRSGKPGERGAAAHPATETAVDKAA